MQINISVLVCLLICLTKEKIKRKREKGKSFHRIRYFHKLFVSSKDDSVF